MVALSGNRALDAYLCYLPCQVQPSGAAKYAQANKQILGDNFPAMLGCGPCETKGGKDKNELGYIYHRHIYSNKARKVMWNCIVFISQCTVGESNEFVGAAKETQYSRKKTQCRVTLNKHRKC